MALFVYVTAECEKEAEHHGYQSDLARFRERIEAIQDVRQFDPFPPPYMVKKKFGGRQGRLIAAFKPDIRGHSVIVLLGLMIRGDAAYEDQFSRDPVEYGRKHFDHLYSDAQLESYVAQRTAAEPPPAKPEPTLPEYGYLHLALNSRSESSDGVICESIEWVQRTNEAPFKNRLETIFAAISKDTDDDRPGGKCYVVDAQTGVSIITRSFPELKLRLLVAPLALNEDVDKLGTATKDALLSDAPSLETVLQASRRAYPPLLLADLDLWMELERDTQANLALSPEETRLLETARNPEGGFPLFINGRAGSGKTTILQYLFTEYLYYHLTTEERGPSPIYFTCNSELLSQSRRMVEKLLRCNAQWWEHPNREKWIAENQVLLDAAFREFHAHFYSMLPAAEQGTNFARDRYVNFAKFKRLWHERFCKESKALREFGPDISWHVIRSYIKGLTAEVYLEPEEYRHLDQKQITVTQKTYELVFDKVWTRWYKQLCEDQKYWDDQDVARYLLDQDLIRAEHSAVFCDESQDFTRIELEILLRSSIYSERRLDTNDVARVPFIFAGDQFQTLNPTGFRWDAIKASFVEKFIFALDPGRRSRLKDLNYQELVLNYRSSRSIVNFSNFVQALRGRLFDLPGLVPQQAWDRETNCPPVIGINSDNEEFWDRLKRERDIAIIVPCGEGEELEWINADPVLRRRIKIEDGVPDALVLSSARAKGLEFARVVVYGFGDAPEAQGDLLHPLHGKESYAGDPDKSLPYQYFINRLYVAVSRAKRRLFVVDSKPGFERLWAFARDEGLEGAIIKGLKHGESTWAKALSRLELGMPGDLSLDRTQDPREHADSLASQGRAAGDSLMLLYAAASYRNLGEQAKADWCKADALVIQQSFLAAGQTYLLCNRVSEAVDCFWRARREGWRAMVDIAEKYPEILLRLEFAVAQAAVRPAVIDMIAKALSRIGDRVSTPEGAMEIGANPVWAEAVRALLDKSNGVSADHATWAQLAAHADRISSHISIVPDSLRGTLHYRANAMSAAVQHWERCNETATHEYKLAKAQTAPFPERLGPMFDVGKQAEIIRECAENPTVVLTGRPAEAASEAHLENGLIELALRYAIGSRKKEQIMKVVSRLPEGSGPIVARAIGAYYAVAASRSETSLFLQHAEKGPVAALRPPKSVSTWLENNAAQVDLAWVRAIARFGALSEVSWDDRKSKINRRPMAEYLRRTFFSSGRPLIERGHERELGAAFELLGNRTDALAYYEWMADQYRGDNAEHLYARRRWVVCKERQAEFESSRGDEKSARLHRDDAAKVRQAPGILDAELPAYPSLGSAEELAMEFAVPAAPRIEIAEVKVQPAPAAPSSAAVATAPDAKVEIAVGFVRFEFYRPAGKLVIRETQTGASASFRANSPAQAMDVTVVGDGPGRWIIPEWSIEVESHTTVMVILLRKEGTSITLLGATTAVRTASEAVSSRV